MGSFWDRRGVSQLNVESISGASPLSVSLKSREIVVGSSGLILCASGCHSVIIWVSFQGDLGIILRS